MVGNLLKNAGPFYYLCFRLILVLRIHKKFVWTVTVLRTLIAGLGDRRRINLGILSRVCQTRVKWGHSR